MKKYSLLKAYPIAYDEFSDDNHFFIHALAGNEDYSLAVNVESNTRETVLKYEVRTYGEQELLSLLHLSKELKDSLYRQDRGEMKHYLDYYEQDLASFNAAEKEEIPEENRIILSEKLKELTEKAIASPSAYTIAYGALWGPKAQETDRTFGFRPAQGLHDIHCNQKSPVGSPFAASDVPHKDGAIFFIYPEEKKAVGVYTAFC